MTKGARRPDPSSGAATATDVATQGPPARPSQTLLRQDDELPSPAPRQWLERAVPVRRRASVDGAPLRAAFLLSHVDDRMTIAELAACAQLPLADAVEAFTLLADLGLVELRAPSIEPRPTAKSGLHPKNG